MVFNRYYKYHAEKSNAEILEISCVYK